jgi:hypothetical protein
MNRSWIAWVAVLGLLANVSLATAETLQGRQVLVEYLYPDVNTLWGTNRATVTVGSSVELPEFAVQPADQTAYLSIDLFDTNLRITNLADVNWTNSVPFNGLHFQDANGTIPAFESVALNIAMTTAGLNPSMISFDADNIWINWPGLSGTTGQFASVDVHSAPAVPEPSMLIGLGGMAVLGACLALRKRVQAK